MTFGPPPINRWIVVVVVLGCLVAAYLAVKG